MKPMDLASALHRAGVPFAWLDAQLHETRSFIAFDPLQVCQGSDLSELDQIPTEESGLPTWFGFVSYDAWRSSPELVGVNIAPSQQLAFHFVRYRNVLQWQNESWSGTADALQIAERLVHKHAHGPSRVELVGELQITRAELHEARVRRALDAIGRGDFYQVNLARRFSFLGAYEPFELYKAMRQASPVPFGAYLEGTFDETILSSSMELFLRWSPSRRWIQTRPIKGTVADNSEAQNTLLADPKERAEHGMIVDLMRNDLSKVSEVGSVRVAALFEVERYRHLLHLVSTVEATAKHNLSLSSLLSATFPPGSISGTPKSTAVEFIHENEDFRRGVYCGSIGYFGGNDGLCLSVAIRTARATENRVDYYAGGGIVAASDPTREVRETELKAAVFFDALRALGFDSQHPRP